MPMSRRRLPTGIQTFREIREQGCYYVDRTPYILRLPDGGKHYFLSRPRRFGKSLFLDTCKELFEGNEPLFEHRCFLRSLYATIKDSDADIRRDGDWVCERCENRNET